MVRVSLRRVDYQKRIFESTKFNLRPEPSVALMGLLGPGMLLKRRRA
jgi:hypothetical protein